MTQPKENDPDDVQHKGIHRLSASLSFHYLTYHPRPRVVFDSDFDVDAVDVFCLSLIRDQRLIYALRSI
jgi:hypothetical protein